MENITQKELANRLSISRSQLCEILSGKKRPSRVLALKLESASGVGRVAWLYGNSQTLRNDLENSLGRKINFRRGRPQQGGQK